MPEMYHEADTGLCPRTLEKAYRCSNVASLVDGVEDGPGLVDALEYDDEDQGMVELSCHNLATRSLTGVVIDATYFTWATAENILAEQDDEVATRDVEIGSRIVFRWTGGWCLGTVIGYNLQKDGDQENLPWDVE